MLKDDRLTGLLGFSEETRGKKTLKKLEQLRNDLAHAQDIITGRWPDLADLTTEAENLLERLETASVVDSTVPD